MGLTVFIAMAFATTFNGCPIQHATYAPLVVEACGQVWLSTKPGLAVYSHDAVLMVPGPVSADRVFGNGFN